MRSHWDREGTKKRARPTVVHWRTLILKGQSEEKPENEAMKE